MVTVQFNFKTIIEAQEFLAGMTQQTGRQPEQPKFSHPTEAVSGRTQATAEELTLMKTKIEEANAALDVVVEAKKKRGPKPKAEVAAEKALAKEYGIEDCRNALSSLFDEKGREVAKSVLSEFKVDRVTYLKPEQYRDFIIRCESASKPE